MIRLIDPNATINIRIDDVTFHVKQMTNADKLKIQEKLTALEVTNEGFEELMDQCADLVVTMDVPGYVCQEGRLQAIDTSDESVDWPADALTIREFIQRIDDIQLQRKLFEGICAVAKLNVNEAKN